MLIGMQRTRSRVLAIALAALLAGGFTAGCSSDSAEPTSSDAVAVTPSPGVVALVEPNAFAATIEAPGVTVIDVRTPEEFAQGHIEGAVNIDLQDTAAFIEGVAVLNPDDPYAVYCRSGNRSAAATSYLTEQGFVSIVELQDGIVAWEDAGLPVVQ